MATAIPTDTITAITMTETVPGDTLYKLMSFFSPAFPVGAFTYSHGLEQAVEAGQLNTPGDVDRWIADILQVGAGRSDAILLAHAYRAAEHADHSALNDIIDLGLALQPSKERHLESTAQGTAFMSTFLGAWAPKTKAQDTPSGLAERQNTDERVWPYPVAAGAAASISGLPLKPVLTAYLQAFASNLVSAAIRTVPLGQTQGQISIAALLPVCTGVGEEALEAGLDDLGTASFLADIASMNHETQYTRLFRS